MHIALRRPSTNEETAYPYYKLPYHHNVYDYSLAISVILL